MDKIHETMRGYICKGLTIHILIILKMYLDGATSVHALSKSRLGHDLLRVYILIQQFVCLPHVIVCECQLPAQRWAIPIHPC